MGDINSQQWESLCRTHPELSALWAGFLQSKMEQERMQSALLNAAAGLAVSSESRSAPLRSDNNTEELLLEYKVPSCLTER